MLKEFIIFFILIIIFSGCIEKENKEYENEQEQKTYSYSNISIKDVRTSITPSTVIVDVREPEEYANCRINNSILIPLGEVEKRYHELLAYKDKEIIVVCRSGSRSATAAELLIELGFTNISNMEGGIVAWYVSGYDLVGECRSAPEFRMEDIIKKNEGWDFVVGKGCS